MTILKEKLNQARLKELLHYDPETGVFTWKVRKAPWLRIGSIAGWQGDRYRQIRIDNSLYSASRLAWLYIEGYFPEYEVDHIDTIKSNNKWENLRVLTHACNTKNIFLKSNNTSGVNGVCWDCDREKWLAQLKNDGTRVLFKRFSNKIDAITSRWEAEKKYNWPNCQTNSSAYLYLKERGLAS